jgi:8-oxo-dGTP pyrophosphatase MutT (NUDIX family)
MTRVGAVCLRHGKTGPEVLLIKNAAGQRIYPKGKVKPGELEWSVAERELREETGWDGWAIFDPIGSYPDRKGQTVIAYLVIDADSVWLGEPGREPEWFTFAAAQERFHAEQEEQVACEMSLMLLAALRTWEKLCA